MYYLLVYAQLTILTHPLFKLLKAHRTLLYIITPCTLVAREILALLKLDDPSISVLFPTWLIYYLFGLEWHRWHEILQRKRKIIIVAAFLALLMQIFEGLLWESYGDYNMATTQLRITNMTSALSIITLFMFAAEHFKSHFSQSFRAFGDLSFGIYLCHVGFIAVFPKSLL